MKIKFEEVKVEPDGNCLYRSMSMALPLLKLSHVEIRRMINFVIKTDGKSLEKWVKMETGMDLDRYLEVMKMDGEWGGAIELKVMSKFFKVNIFVLSKNSENQNIEKEDRYSVISSFIHNNKSRCVFLLFKDLHYNYLRVIENNTDIKT